jgi:cytoskeletal protein CcmA (bactofilin family)
VAVAQETFKRKGGGGGGETSQCIIGKNIQIRGKLAGSEDLVVEGRIEGTVALKNHLTIEQTGVVDADVEVKDLTVHGEMRGDISADGTVSVSNAAKVVGNIRAPRIILEDGARFKGSIEMDVELPSGIEKKSKRERA